MEVAGGIPRFLQEWRKLDTDVLNDKMARLMRARHCFVVGLQDLEHVQRNLALDGLSPLHANIETARSIIDDLDCALYVITNFEGQ